MFQGLLMRFHKLYSLSNSILGLNKVLKLDWLPDTITWKLVLWSVFFAIRSNNSISDIIFN